MKKIFTLLLIGCACISSLDAQNAKDILDRASDSFFKDGAIVAKFTLNSKELGSNQVFSQDGTAHMKGDKFKIEVPQAITWFDGKTQWTYVKDIQEVNISTPTGAELQAISPSILFSLYKSGYDLNYKGEKKLNNKVVLEIEMIAQNKKNELKKVIVSINKVDYTFAKIVLLDSNNMENTLIINSYQKSESLADSFFTFNKKDYPEAEIIDLR